MGILPATVPVERVVARTPEVAVYLASVSAYPGGFEFDVFVVMAERRSELDPFGFEHRMVAERTGEIPPGLLRLGFRFGDGSKATNTGAYFHWDEDTEGPPDAPYMSGGGGSGGGDHSGWHKSFWVWPIPPPGKFEFLCEWPDAGIPLTALELDGNAITEAGARSQEMLPAD